MKISGYMTSKNSLSMGYPFEEAIRSLFSFCDEIVICDTSDGTDNTKEKLEALQKEFAGELKIIHNPDEVDWTAPNSGIYDGITKGIARSGCTGDYCFQIDADEVIETTREDIEKCCEQLDDEHPLLALPVIEYWGSQGKVRIDVNPWKWRLSKNLPNITHGIPGSHRKHENRLLYAYPGTDGCVTPDTKIMTIEGEKLITDIKVGDLVLTHKGRFRKVTRFYKRPEKKWDLFQISSKNYFNEPIKITGNHPIYFSKLKRLHKRPWKQIVKENFLMLDEISPTKNDCFTFPKLKIPCNKELFYEYKTKNCVSKIYPNNNIGFLIGFYLGDGCIIRRTDNKKKFKNVSFALSSYQDNIVIKLEKILFQEFGIKKIYKRKYKKKNWWDVRVHNSKFAEFIYRLCKTGSKEKLLESSFFEWDQQSILGILEGLYESDGANCRSGINIAMTNGQLLSQIKMLATKINLFPSLTSYQKMSGYGQKPIEMFQFRITGKQVDNLPWIDKSSTKRNNHFIEHENYFAVSYTPKSTKIDKIIYHGNLYNLEVEEDYSYIANGITVHNCDYIDKNSLKTIPCIGFVPQKVEEVRQRATFDKDYVVAYENWLNQITDKLPTVHHFSWWSIYSKMLKYKLFWNNSWITLYNEKRPEGYNPFFNKPFDQVTEQEMRDTAVRIETETGGHIFHSPWSGQKINHIATNKPIPKIIQDWCEKNKEEKQK